MIKRQMSTKATNYYKMFLLGFIVFIIYASLMHVRMGKMNRIFIELFYSLSSFDFFQLNGYFAKFAESIKLCKNIQKFVTKITFMSVNIRSLYYSCMVGLMARSLKGIAET